MKTLREPPRLLELLGEGDPLRDVLEAGCAEQPGEAQLASLWDRVVSTPPGPGGDGGPAPGDGGGPAPADPPVVGPGGSTAAASSVGGSAVKLAAVLALAGAAALATMPAADPDGSASPPRAWAQIAAEAQLPRLAPPTPATEASDEPAAATETKQAPPRPSAAQARPPHESEVGLLMKARAALAGAPAEALRLVAEAGRLYPRGNLGPEREVIRIQALAGVGRRSEAVALSRALIARSPESAYARRLAALFPEIAAP